MEKMKEIWGVRFWYTKDGVENNNYWYTINFAAFTHRTDGEFMFYLHPDDELGMNNFIQEMRDEGCSEDYIKEFIAASEQGADYLLLYSI